ASFFPFRVPLIGIGSFSLGPTQPVTFSPARFNNALPVIVPSDAEIVTRQLPETSAARAGAANEATNNTLNKPSRSIHMFLLAVNRRKPRSKVHRIQGPILTVHLANCEMV